MIRFFKISLKALQRFKTAAILNLLGLALAFTAFLVIVLHTWNEYNYDNYHPNKEHIFKVEFFKRLLLKFIRLIRNFKQRVDHSITVMKISASFMPSRSRFSLLRRVGAK